jgi:hypothetical protein
MVWNIGFDDGMGVTYSMMEMDGDIRKIAYVDTTREPAAVGGGFDQGRLNCGRLIKPDHVPTKLFWDGPPNRKLPDAMFGRGMLKVSDSIKTIIEKFEPGVHQFFPVDVYFKSTKKLARKMFYLNICTRLDSVDRKLTTCKLDYSMWRPDQGGELVFNLDQIGNHHLWHDKHILDGWYASDPLKNEMVTADISGLVFNKRKTNVEWA